MKILIIEDNRELQHQITQRLQTDGYDCETAGDFRRAGEKTFDYDYDLLIVDINLPGGSGLDIIREMKSNKPTVPIIVISARNAMDQKIEGLETGADDYITKPFNLAELSARVKSVIRRWSFSGSRSLRIGNITLDTDAKTVYAGTEPLDLTRTEYRLLLYFFSNAGRVLTRESMAEHIWGDHMDLADSYDFIYSHVKNLRKKIKQTGCRDPIKVVYGVGYKLEKS